TKRSLTSFCSPAGSGHINTTRSAKISCLFSLVTTVDDGVEVRLL
ncbi:unnamed protein product, partial [Allacma fusca]